MTVPPAEPSLDGEERAALARGIAEFNAGLFFECHDTLEDMWAGLRGPSRDFFQGLIQVSVAYYHLGNGNAAGAESMMRRALKRLEKYPARYCGFDAVSSRLPSASLNTVAKNSRDVGEQPICMLSRPSSTNPR